MCDGINQVYLLGAGFTRAVMGDAAPLTDELMARLDISTLPEIQNEYEETYPDIEQFLSMLDLRVIRWCRKNKSLADHLNQIRDDIVSQIFDCVDVTRLRVDNLGKYQILKQFVESVPSRARILTLNYDCVLDQGLYLSRRWSPRGGYDCPPFPASGEENDCKEQILLLKLHGSCNFRERMEGDPYFKIELTGEIFPGMASNINSGGTPRLLVMSYIKIFDNGIFQLWRKAISYLKDAEKLTIVGCSLREEDTFLRYALYCFGMRDGCKKFQVEIVDKGDDRCKEIERRVMGLVAYPGRHQVTRFPGGLAEWLKGRTDSVV